MSYIIIGPCIECVASVLVLIIFHVKVVVNWCCGNLLKKQVIYLSLLGIVHLILHIFNHAYI